MKSSVSRFCGLLVLGGLFVLAMTSCGTSSKVVADAEGSDEVNVGYGYISKDDLNSAVSKANFSAKSEQSYSNIWNYITGHIPGVFIRGGGDGSTPQIYIRGIGTNSGETQPLFIVDGVQMQDISYLLPSDVSSIEVIKDGSAAIYGAQSANGVIMITTKMAKARADAEAAAKKAARQAKRKK